MRIFIARLGVFLFAVVMAACESTQDGQQQGDNLEASQDEGDGQNANSDNGNGGNFDGQGGNDGQFVNNAEDEEFAQQDSGQEFQGEQLNNAGLDTDQSDPFAGNALTEPAAGQSANEIPAAPPVANSFAPTGGGIVKYAPANVEIFDQPNGKLIGQFEKGDHPLVYEESGWSRTFDGRYVNQSALSPKGIGRPRNPGVWR